MRRGFDSGGIVKYIQHTLEQSSWTQLDSTVNVFFVAVLLAGVVFFVFAQMSDYEPRGYFSRHLFPLFLITAFSYLIWITDLVFGLPFGWSRFVLVPLLMGGGLAQFLIVGFLTSKKERSFPIAEGYKRCPQCKSIILELTVQCPECGKKFKD